MTTEQSLDSLRRVIEKHWGYRSFRPLQEPAMQASLGGRDSVVVMPTGGGKSLCYQAPAVLKGGTTVVVSPLISLMKDQVDGLRACGIAAAQIDSSLSSTERSAYEMDLMQGEVRLLFVSPERLAVPDFCRLLQRVDVTNFAIDEAHCISHWGHDFRPDYRQLGRLRELFPRASLHGYTATATERVRQDICQQLHLNDPLVLVGSFDRPNLTYRILPRLDEFAQIREVLDRHKGEAGIIYCIRRTDVDNLAAALRGQGIRAVAYHAGLDKDARQKAQEAFKTERCDLVVATVAFGMGIDRSNIRFVIHAAMPKSIEHYQQETGRAGRDGLEAECVLLHGAADFMTWKRIMTRPREDGAPLDPEHQAIALKHLDDIDKYCRGAVCRHRALVSYFGQKYEPEGCAACDICLGDTEPVAECLVIAQKILSCVARVQERFGAGHVVSVLRGEKTERIRSLGHDKLSTYGLLREHDKQVLRDWVHQLVSQGVLAQEGDEYPILKLNEGSWQVMKKERTIRLIQRARKESKRSKADTESWEGVDRDLFEDLRDLRRELAQQRSVPPYIIFGDATLRDLARVRPSTPQNMGRLYGIGQRKLDDFGEQFLTAIRTYCETQGVAMDVAVHTPKTAPAKPKAATGVKATAFELFRQGLVPEDVAHQTGRTLRAILGDLAEFIRLEPGADAHGYVNADTFDRVAAAAKKVGTARLKPIFDALDGKIPYEDIRLVVAQLEREAETKDEG